MSTDSMRPVEIDLDRTRELRIRWSDGHQSRIELTVLRKHCPCANCRAEEAQRTDRLPVLPDGHDERAMVTAAGAELVGTYALRIRWNDGHAAGLYDFALLREMG